MPSNGICDLCDAEILWARTAKTGKPMPIDPAPCADGNVAVYRDHTGRINARVLKKGEEPESYEKRGKAHFATCPKYPQVMAARRQRNRDAAIQRAPQPPGPPPANVVNIRTARRRRNPSNGDT
jgi:hypothetical protein